MRNSIYLIASLLLCSTAYGQSNHATELPPLTALLTEPLVSVLLICLILGGLFLEIKTAGIGLPMLVSLMAALLFFVPLYQLGVATPAEMCLFAAGIVLVLIEIFVIPGVGIVGIAGILFTLGGLVAAMLPNKGLDFSGVERTEIVSTAVLVGGSLLLLVGFIIYEISNIQHSYLFKRFASDRSLLAEKGFTLGQDLRDLIGKQVIAQTPLRPVGKVIYKGNVYTAQLNSGFAEPQDILEVTQIESNLLKVRKI